MLPQYFLILLIPVILYITYSNVRLILERTYKPNLSSYVIWTLAVSVAIIGSLLKGATIFDLATNILVDCMMMIVILLSIIHRQYYIDTTNLDKVCFVLGMFGVVTLVFVQEKNIAIIISIIVDFIACLPILFKLCFSKTESDNIISFSLSVIIISINLLTIKNFSFETGGFLFYTLFTNALISLSIFVKNNKLRN